MNLCVFLSFAFLPALEPRLVRTSYGFLEGMPIKSIKNTTCWIFKGVPFAQPPVGEFRFKLPIPPKPWEGVRSAKQYSAACLTNSSTAMNQAEHISEDCLYMNIFASERCRSGIVSCPVIFYIHGGALYKGSAIMFDDQYITDRYSSKDIVFVTTAFRLGFFGVLAFETDDIVPRNLALYDIISGLNFTHSEIAAFGGDPTRVTVMGHSQGGSIAMILAVSSIVDPDKRLFQRLIATSPALNYINSTIRGDLTWRVAYEVGCTKSAKRPHPTPLVELGRVVDCLRSVNAFDLLARQRSLEDNEKLLFDGVLFAPPFVRNDTLFRDFLSDCTPRPMMCSSTRDEFNFQKSDDTYDIGAFLMVAHPTEVRDKYYEDKKSGKIKDAYLTQVVFTLNVMFGSRFVEKGSDVYLMEYGGCSEELRILDVKGKLQWSDERVDHFAMP
ncbi:hypothetical protein RB195_017403 [Necator americanus]|uniref:Carboxylesterase type B domain-containing protein n=1 Tax=Necator americanus TaxID=51031 RepID=A0ABR1C525_NECAM